MINRRVSKGCSALTVFARCYRVHKWLKRRWAAFRHRLCLTVLLLVFSNAVLGQSADSSFVETFPQKLNFRLQFVTKGGDLRVRNFQQEGRLLYLPRYQPRVGVGGFLWNIGFSLLLPLPSSWIGQDKRIRRFDFQSSVFATRWLVNGIFQRYRGFTLRRAGVFLPRR